MTRAWRTMLLVALLNPGAALGQSVTQVAAASTFVPGGKELFTLDLAGTRVGTLPRGLERVSGSFEVVLKDGVPMVRTTEQSEFLIRLASALPESFTIEADVIPKDCCPPPDLTLEGTALINQGPGSAHLLWTADATHGWVGVIGGAQENREFQIPDEIRATLPGSLSHVGVSVEGKTIRFYTNGKQLYETQAQFARGSVLRVTLGGLPEFDGKVLPVYLSRIRIATGPPTVVATALPASNTATITPIATMQPTQTAPASSGALATGPISGNPASAANADALAAPAARVITLTGSTGAGYLLVAHSIALPEITSAGSHGAVAQRTISLTGVTGSGSKPNASSRTIDLTAVTAVGSASIARSTDPAPRTVSLTEATSSGAVPTAAPRTIELPAVSAAGQSSIPALRRITLGGVTATGPVGIVPSRTVKLAGVTASGAKTP